VSAGEIERGAMRLWREWGGAWSRYTVCHSCGSATYCGAARRRGPYLCVDCFDQSEHADRLIAKRSS